MIKTYRCPIHEEFDHECKLSDGELKECPKCNKPVTRIFKSLTYMDSEGFVGKVYGIP